MGVDAEVKVAEDEGGHVGVVVVVEALQGVLQRTSPVLRVGRRRLVQSTHMQCKHSGPATCAETGALLSAVLQVQIRAAMLLVI